MKFLMRVEVTVADDLGEDDIDRIVHELEIEMFSVVDHVSVVSWQKRNYDFP